MRNVYYLDREDVLAAATAALGHTPEIRDSGVLEAALAPPETKHGISGDDRTLLLTAAALLNSILKTGPFTEGNECAAWAGAWVFLTLNGMPLTRHLHTGMAERLITRITTERLPLSFIAVELRKFSAV